MEQLPLTMTGRVKHLKVDLHIAKMFKRYVPKQNIPKRI